MREGKRRQEPGSYVRWELKVGGSTQDARGTQLLAGPFSHDR